MRNIPTWIWRAPPIDALLFLKRELLRMAASFSCEPWSKVHLAIALSLPLSKLANTYDFQWCCLIMPFSLQLCLNLYTRLLVRDCFCYVTFVVVDSRISLTIWGAMLEIHRRENSLQWCKQDKMQNLQKLAITQCVIVWELGERVHNNATRYNGFKVYF